MRFDIRVCANYCQFQRRFTLKNTPKRAEIVQNTVLPMSHKSCDRKWVNKVGDLKTCTEKPNIMNKNMYKNHDLRPYGFGCGGGPILMQHPVIEPL